MFHDRVRVDNRILKALTSRLHFKNATIYGNFILPFEAMPYAALEDGISVK